MNKELKDYCNDLKKNQRASQYWICSNCAMLKKWVEPQFAVTVVHGLCGWCKRSDEAILIPTCDFQKPGERTPLWD